MENKKQFIDVGDALEKLKNANRQIGVTIGDISVNGFNAVTIEAVIHFLERCKNVDAVEVVHGKWIELGSDDTDDLRWICSNCGEAFFEYPGRNNFCPNCGAKMDLED